MAMSKTLPDIGFVRVPTILEVLPISRAGWWQGVKDGKYPAGIKLGPRTTVWRVEDISALIKKLGEKNPGEGEK